MKAVVIICQITFFVLLLKAIVKWRNHPSILTRTSEHENTPKYCFNFVLKEYVLEEMQMLDSSKAVQESDIPLKLIKENSHLFADNMQIF